MSDPLKEVSNLEERQTLKQFYYQGLLSFFMIHYTLNIKKSQFILGGHGFVILLIFVEMFCLKPKMSTSLSVEKITEEIRIHLLGSVNVRMTEIAIPS